MSQAEPEIARLSPGEAEQVFDALKAKVTVAEDLGEQPPGVLGLAAVSKHHSFLQSSFVALMRSLPAAKLGPWAVSGWARALTDNRAKADFAI